MKGVYRATFKLPMLAVVQRLDCVGVAAAKPCGGPSSRAAVPAIQDLGGVCRMLSCSDIYAFCTPLPPQAVQQQCEAHVQSVQKARREARRFPKRELKSQ